MAKPTKYINRWTIEAIRDHVKEAGNREVYLVGTTNHQKIVEEVTVFARGNDDSVPAIMQVTKYGDVVIHNHPSGLLEPSQADIEVATQLGNNGIGFYIVNNTVTDLYAVVEAMAPEEVFQLDPEELSRLLSPDGVVNQKLSGYEYRPEQIEMIKTICQSFNEEKIAIIEAGTGVGKTMAYLLPAIYWAVKNNERCAISTNTINLQEQLIKKDIPFLQRVLNLKFKGVLVKGRRNYACLRKVDDIRAEFELLAEENEKEELETLIEWARNSRDGSKADLNFIPKISVWDKIAADSETCLRTKCPHYKACFVNRARRDAVHADILVVNHHLLFADLAVRQAGGEVAVLPTYHRLILDEAHHIEDVATSYFGARITRIGLLRMMGQLHRRVKGKDKGLFHILLNRLRPGKSDLPAHIITRVDQLIQLNLIPALDELDSQLSMMMESIFQIVKEKANNDFGETKLRLTKSTRQIPNWQQLVLTPAENFITSLRLFTNKVTALLKVLDSIKNTKDEKLLALRTEIDAKAARLEEAANTIELVLFQTSSDIVRWIEVVDRYQYHIVRLQASPLDVAELLHKNIYEMFKTVILTSATLTVSGLPKLDKFEYLENRIGLNLVNKINRLEKVLPAPFNYREQAVLIIPRDMPAPNQQMFAGKLSEGLLRALQISQGRAFVLFTSYSLLNMMFNQLEEPLRAAGITVFKQGGENRHRMLERFRQNKKAALFGTDSFWEGVDVQGKALESVIITKLPFKVPSEPVIEARIEAITQRGGNAFMEYSVPQAAIKFKQGFGRLIRSKSDRGSVIIFDKRIVEKFYGKVFIKSLPDCRIVSGTSESVFHELARFFGTTE